jgi:predicted RNase H-like HicB family nuclease
MEFDEYYVISDNEINMYGVGDTIAEAEEDYKSVVLSYLEDLEENESKLDERLKGHLYYIREKLSVLPSIHSGNRDGGTRADYK